MSRITDIIRRVEQREPIDVDHELKLITLDFARQGEQFAEEMIDLIETLDDAHALEVVLEPVVALHQTVEHLLAGVAERGVTHIVAEADRFGQGAIEAEGSGDGATDLCDLECVREACYVVVTLGIALTTRTFDIEINEVASLR